MTMDRFREYIAGLGISGSLIAAVIVAFLVLGGAVSFNSWPGAPQPDATEAVLVGEREARGVPAPATPAELAVVPPLTSAALATPLPAAAGGGPGAISVPDAAGDLGELPGDGGTSGDSPPSPPDPQPPGPGPNDGDPDTDPPSRGLGALLADLVRPLTQSLPDSVGDPAQDTVDGVGRLVDDLTVPTGS